MRYESRDQIEEQYKWDLSSMCESDEALEDGIATFATYPEKFAAFQGKISTSAVSLLEFMSLDDEVSVLAGKLFNYAQRKGDENVADAKYQNYITQLTAVYTQLAASQAWFSSELLTLDEEQMAAFYSEEPGLELYRRIFDRIFARREHTLSPAEERILALSTQITPLPSQTYSVFADAEMTFEDAVDSAGETHPISHGSYIPLMQSRDRELRKSAFENLYASYKQFHNTCASILTNELTQQKFYAEARNYPTTLEAALDSSEVPAEVYTNLIDTVRKNLPAMYKYVDMRKRRLGVDELHFYDLYAPIVDEVEMEFTYEEACETILKALEPMGEEYLAIVRKGLAERWVDVYETPGKRSGAYSAGSYGTHPVMLLNFQGKLDDVFTLIHEMGHSIHTYLSCANQPVCYSDYVIFVAEVASTCNEALLTDYLLKNTTDPAQRAYILNHFLEQFRATIYRQTLFAEFELKANEMLAAGQGTTGEALCELYRQLNEDYFGPNIVVDDEIAYEWARIPHFYYHYYVYQYATGFAAAIALSQRIINEGAPAVADYLGFLSGGSSKPPLDLLRGAGVDMASTEPIDAALAWFDKLIDEMDEVE